MQHVGSVSVPLDLPTYRPVDTLVNPYVNTCNPPPAVLRCPLPIYDERPVSETWLIWANDHGGWHRRGGYGYTRNDREAHRFTADEAAELVARAGAFPDGTPQQAAVRAPTNRVPAPIELPADTVERLVTTLQRLTEAGDFTDGDLVLADAVRLEQMLRRVLDGL